MIHSINSEFPDIRYSQNSVPPDFRGIVDTESPQNDKSEFSGFDTVDIEPIRPKTRDLYNLALAGTFGAAFTASLIERKFSKGALNNKDKYPTDESDLNQDKISRRRFLRNGAVVTAGSILAMADPHFALKKIAELAGVADGPVAQTAAENLINPLIYDYVFHESYGYNLNCLVSGLRPTFNIENIIEGNTHTTIVSAVDRLSSSGKSHRMGSAYVTAFKDNRAPYIANPPQFMPGVLNSTQEFACNELLSKGIEAPVSVSGWCSHHALAYASARRFKTGVAESHGGIRRATLAYYLNPPGKLYKSEWGYPTNPSGNDRTPVYNWYLEQLGLIYDTSSHRGYPQTSVKYVAYKYHDDSWDYEVLDSREISQLLHQTGSGWSYFLPNLIVNKDNKEKISYLKNGKPNLLESQANYVARDSSGRLVSGVAAGGLSTFLTPMEFWDLISDSVKDLGLSLENVFYTDSGGSMGFAVPEKCDANYGRSYKNTHVFGRNIDEGSLKDTDVFGAEIGAAIEDAIKIFPIWHTVGQMQLYLKPEDLRNLPNYMA